MLARRLLLTVNRDENNVRQGNRSPTSPSSTMDGGSIGRELSGNASTSELTSRSSASNSNSTNAGSSQSHFRVQGSSDTTSSSSMRRKFLTPSRPLGGGLSSSSSTTTKNKAVIVSKLLPLSGLVLFALVFIRQQTGMYSKINLESSLLSFDVDKAWQQLTTPGGDPPLLRATASFLPESIVDCDNNNNDDREGPPRDSSTATVLSMATGYGLTDYERFVGSLRKTGYKGHIILAVAPTMDDLTRRYLLAMNTTLYHVRKMNCTYQIMDESQVKTSHDEEIRTCLYPYPSLKHRWARYPLLRDLLINCTTCTGPVLHTDLRDTLFQRDPFGPDAPPVNGLQVFEEHYSIRTTNWVSDWPVYDCKGIHIDEPMLCSGTTIGTREAMIGYFDVMHEEMEKWMASPKCCCFQTNADDQAMHNWLFYGTDLLWRRPTSKIINNTQVDLTPSQLQRRGRINAIAVQNRQGIVNTVGAQASLIHTNHMRVKEKYLPKEKQVDMHSMPFDGSGYGYNGLDKKPNEWLGVHHGMTDEDGYVVQNDGSRSFVLHQIDRFGLQYYDWINKNINDLIVTHHDLGLQ